MIIKCPECGHNVSDKAPMCPGCGVEIAGHIRQCGRCGNIYLDTEPSCPTCKEQQMMEEPVAPSQPVTATVETRETQTEEPEPIVRVLDYEEEAVRPMPKPSAAPNKTEGKGKATLMVSFLIAALICATMLYFYKDAIDNNQQDSEQLSQQIGEETDENGDATEGNEDTQNGDDGQENNTMTEDDSAAEELKTDSTDWVQARSINTKESYNRYTALHPNGKHVAQAEEAIKKLNVPTLTQAESQKAFNSVRSFFIAINKKDREALSSTVAPVLTSFDGKTAAQRSDVIQYMVDLYQADVKNLNWHLGNVTNINKHSISDDRFEYEVIIPAKKVTERENSTSTIEYIVRAIVNPDGKVSAMNMTRKQ